LFLDDHLDQLATVVRRVQSPTSPPPPPSPLGGASVAESIEDDAAATLNNGFLPQPPSELNLERVKSRLQRQLQQLGAACEKLKRQPDVAALTRLSNEQVLREITLIFSNHYTFLWIQVKEINSLEQDLVTLNRLAADSQTTLICAQDCLLSVSENLAQIYHHVCTVQGANISIFGFL